MIFFAVFGVFVMSVANGLRNCDNCTKLNECPEASYQVNNIYNIETITKLGAAMCSNDRGVIKFCCSDFSNTTPTPDKNIPQTNDNEAVIENHRNIYLLSEECGTIESDRIIGGQVASLYEFPWLVLLSSANAGSNRNPEFHCGGTLINRRYVLTAAHCTRQHVSSVRVGEYDISKKRDCFGRRPWRTCESRIQDIPVTHTIVHPKYKRQPVVINDIALLRLRDLVDFSPKNAAAICLPVFENLLKTDVCGEIGTVAGWGKTETGLKSNILLKVDVPIHPVDMCKSFSRSKINKDLSQAFQSVLCAGEIGADSCQGDSGGPLMLEADYNGTYKYVQYGVVSYGIGCGDGVPAIYTDMRKYMKWILDTIKL